MTSVASNRIADPCPALGWELLLHFSLDLGFGIEKSVKENGLEIYMCIYIYMDS